MRWIERLIQILREEIELFREMRRLLSEERRAIVEGDTNRLLEVVKLKETLAMRHRLLEEAKTSCLKKVGKEDYTLSQLMEELAPNDRELLDPIVTQLRGELENLLWDNKRNTLLIHKAMEINSELIKLFSPFFSLSYNHNGTLSTNF